MTIYDHCVDAYHEGRIGYSNDIYDALVQLGLGRSHRVLDIGCGTGLASIPLIVNGFEVVGIDASPAMLAKARAAYPQARWVAGRAEALPFEDDSFDLVISAQAFHQVDRGAAMEALVRVLRPGGIAALWWKHLFTTDLVYTVRQESAAALDVELPPSGLGRVFREFYAAPLHSQTARIFPWRIAQPFASVIAYERSRAGTLKHLGGAADAYLTEFERRLAERIGSTSQSIVLSYVQYFYSAVKP